MINQTNDVYKMNNIIKVDKDGMVYLDQILKGTNVNQKEVEYYTMENGGKGITVTLFDKDKKQIKVEIRTAETLAKEIKSIMNSCRFCWFPKKLINLIDKAISE